MRGGRGSGNRRGRVSRSDVGCVDTAVRLYMRACVVRDKFIVSISFSIL